MAIDIGKFDRRVVIQAATTTMGASGGVAKTWADVQTVWAQKVETTGREARSAGQLRAETTLAIRIRYQSTLTEQHRLYFDGRYYDVVQITEEGRRESQLVQATYREAATA